ncbi:MAG: sulfatase-like hydrolase/transferase, partial [Planctomycetota bacterium]
MLLPSRIDTTPLLVAKALLTLAVLGLCPFATAEETSRPPNIVLILSDDQAWTDYGFMNHPVIKTPRLDQLAKQSVVFRRGYVPTSLCRPSLMTIVTGQYASVHGVTGNDPSPKYATKGSPLYNQRRDQLISKIDAFDTLPKLLGKAGYVSHQSGKWWEGNYSRGGFDQGMTRGFPQRGGRHGDDGLDIGRKGLQPVTDFID